MKALKPFAVLLLTSAASIAQTPQWNVVVTPTLNPLPIGMCGAVHLTLMDPVTHDVPRNPQGYRITMADFDMSVSGGSSAAGRQIDAYHFDACGCPGGTLGAAATVTARYPAQSLAVASRVPGVSIEKSAPFVIAAPKGAVIPQPCLALAATPPGAPPAAVDPFARNPVQAMTPVPRGTSRTPSPTATSTAPAPAPTPTPAPVPVASTGASAPPTTTVATGAAPQPNYPPVAVGEGPGRTPTSVVPPAPASPAAAAAVTPVNPTGFSASEYQPGEILLRWKPVPEAAFYVVFGPGVDGGGQRVDQGGGMAIAQSLGSNETMALIRNVPAGMQEWAVASYYAGNISTPAYQFPRASLNVPAQPTASAPPATTTPAPTPAATPPPAAAPAQSGKYLVTLTGFRAYRASMDDMLSRDGKGDEVYAATYVRRYDRRTGDLLDTDTRQSAVHGDVTNFGNQRLQGGSASNTGGIQDGDMVPEGGLLAFRSQPAQNVTFPLRLWEGTLTDGVDAVILSPSLWEQDVGDSFYSQWLQFQKTINISLFAKQGVQDQIAQKKFGAVIFGMSGVDTNTGGQSLGRMVLDAGMMLGGAGVPILGLLTTTSDRPLGIVQNGRDNSALPNHTIVLTREIVETALAQPALGAIPSPIANAPSGGLLSGTPAIARIGVIAPKPGIIVVQLEDREIAGTLAFPERPALYQLYIQVERVP